ncbi:MAG: LysR family transcriptional regulator [Moraxella sp.]|nr:LysR family transcriptional regulator [Moraxella sp.]
MLENLRGMAVFASVVRHGSFSGAAKELGITTSAVSQQIRSLESDLGVVLLHRSTRKLSLTEAGASLFESAKSMVKAAEEGRDNVSQLRDGLLGNLRIATTPELASNHIVPALSEWVEKHADLSLRIVTSSAAVDMIDERVDLSIYFTTQSKEVGVVLAKVPQVLLASPAFLASIDAIDSPKALNGVSFIAQADGEALVVSKGAVKETVKPYSRFVTNDAALALRLAKEGYGVVKSNLLEAKEALDKGELVQVLADCELPVLTLCAKTLSKEQQPAKVQRCLEVMTDYFAKK